MPYARNADLPEGVKALLARGQAIYRKAFNSAFTQYNDEAKAHATAWTAVKNVYKKVGDRWITKEADMSEVREAIAKADMSAEDKRRILQAALDEKLPTDSQAYPHSSGPWVRDVFEEHLVYNLGGADFQVDYRISRGGKVTLGEESRKVIATTVYTAIESLREKYAELIQEAGERGVSGDVLELREAGETCTALMDAEEPEEDAVESALSGLDETVKWLRLQEAKKTEDGVKYPAEAFAYVPDVNKPSTWKLRLWQDLDKKVTRSQLGRAAAAFSPGGFRGQKVEIPSDAVAGVKAKIRAAYRKLGVDTEDIPRWVKEVEMRERVFESCEIDIEEVKKDDIAKGIVPVRIIMPGFNTSETRYYSEQAVKDAAEIFEGAKMFADHATESEEREKPERSIRDWVAVLKNTAVSEKGNAVGMAHINAPWLKEKIAALYEQGDLEHLGTSINAVGKGTNQTIEGKKTVLVEGLVKSQIQSVDFVTEPGAGGQAGLRESVQNTLDVDLMDEAQLREARPDLVTIIETGIKESMREEVRRIVETEEKVKNLEGQVETLTGERDGLQSTIDEAVKEKAKAEAQALIKEAVGKAELPEAAKEKLLERFKDATSDEGLADAITEESDYVKTLVGAGKVKGLGGHEETTEEAREATQKRLEESFVRSGMPEEEAKIAAAGRK